MESEKLLQWSLGRRPERGIMVVFEVDVWTPHCGGSSRFEVQSCFELSKPKQSIVSSLPGSHSDALRKVEDCVRTPTCQQLSPTVKLACQKEDLRA